MISTIGTKAISACFGSPVRATSTRTAATRVTYTKHCRIGCFLPCAVSRPEQCSGASEPLPTLHSEIVPWTFEIPSIVLPIPNRLFIPVSDLLIYMIVDVSATLIWRVRDFNDTCESYPV